jgi:tetratricopeptide (TPR) repeat protein
MSSAIELYREAYNLDYRKGDWEAAEELYRKIVKKYPHSEEKEYALVHLDRIEKLKSNPEDQELQPVRSQKPQTSVLSIFNFIFFLILLMAGGFLGYLMWQQYQMHSYNELLMEGFLSEKAGNFKDAAAKYKQAQQFFPQKGLAYRSLAELYLKQGKHEIAEKAGHLWQLAVPYDDNLDEFKKRLKKAQTSGGRKE